MKKSEKIAMKVSIIFLILCVITGLIMFFTNEDNYISLDHPGLIKTPNGYKEVIEWENVITKKNLSSGGPGSTYTYVIHVRNDESPEPIIIDVGDKVYDKFEVGEKVKVITSIYYNKKGLRLSIKHDIYKLEGETNE